MIALAPSILSANFAHLGTDVQAALAGGAERIHVDVMDGHFVPNLSMGPIVVQALRPLTPRPLEVHLMIADPVRYTEAFLKAGANSLILHLEVLPDPLPFLRTVRSRGCKVGVAIKPRTPVDVFAPLVAELDVALCMTVEPGFGGQAFLSDAPARIRQLRGLIERLNPQCELEVDGGIDRTTTPVAVAAGANVLVAGSAIFGSADGATTATRELVRLANSVQYTPTAE
jgi:ribulose-phosphate 3-epimerase